MNAINTKIYDFLYNFPRSNFSLITSLLECIAMIAISVALFVFPGTKKGSFKAGLFGVIVFALPFLGAAREAYYAINEAPGHPNFSWVQQILLGVAILYIAGSVLRMSWSFLLELPIAGCLVTTSMCISAQIGILRGPIRYIGLLPSFAAFSFQTNLLGRIPQMGVLNGYIQIVFIVICLIIMNSLWKQIIKSSSLNRTDICLTVSSILLLNTSTIIFLTGGQYGFHMAVPCVLGYFIILVLCVRKKSIRFLLYNLCYTALSNIVIELCWFSDGSSYGSDIVFQLLNAISGVIPERWRSTTYLKANDLLNLNVDFENVFKGFLVCLALFIPFLLLRIGLYYGVKNEMEAKKCGNMVSNPSCMHMALRWYLLIAVSLYMLIGERYGLQRIGSGYRFSIDLEVWYLEHHLFARTMITALIFFVLIQIILKIRDRDGKNMAKMNLLYCANWILCCIFCDTFVAIICCIEYFIYQAVWLCGLILVIGFVLGLVGDPTKGGKRKFVRTLDGGVYQVRQSPDGNLRYNIPDTGDRVIHKAGDFMWDDDGSIFIADENGDIDKY